MVVDLLDIFNKKKIVLAEDEYIENGYPYCKNCKTARYFVSPDKKFVTNCLCKCQSELNDKKEQEERNERRINRIKELKSLSLLGERYEKCSFETASITNSNKEAYEQAINYCNKNDIVYENNIGLYIHGDNSSGKTHLTACMCNELLSKGRYAVYTNLANIMSEINALNFSTKESNLLSKLKEYDFAFIDDVGKEFIGREHNNTSTKWKEEKLFEIINARYNASKPTVFTSNYSLKELSTTLNIDKSIVERIGEMSTRIIKLEGDNFRKIQAVKKMELAKELGI